MPTKVEVVKLSTASFAGEQKIQDNFLQELQDVVDGGGRVINIVRDDARYKKAYVERHYFLKDMPTT